MKNLFFLIFLSFVVLSSTAFCQSDSVAYDSDTLEEVPVFLSPDFDYLKKVVDDPSSAFYYPALLKRFIAADTTLAIEELHCLYYGSALQEGYSPYGSDKSEYVEKALEILKKEKPSKKELKKALKNLDKAIKESPIDIDLYNYRHYADVLLYGRESAQAGADAFRFIALVSVIAYSGDGKDYPTAFYVVSPSHEYTFIGFNGLRSQGQSLEYVSGKKYDVLSIADNEYGIEKLCFNIDVCFNYLSSLFGGSEEDFGDEDFELASYSSSDNNHPFAYLDSAGMLVIPMNSKVVVRLDTVLDGDQYQFTVVSDETVEGDFDFTKSEEYFSEDGEENTIVFYFVHSQWTDGRKCEVLMMKSFCKEMLSYDTEILYAGSSSFQSTSNDGIFPKVRGTEIWNDPLYAIRLSRFRPMK